MDACLSPTLSKVGIRVVLLPAMTHLSLAARQLLQMQVPVRNSDSRVTLRSVWGATCRALVMVFALILRFWNNVYIVFQFFLLM